VRAEDRFTMTLCAFRPPRRSCRQSKKCLYGVRTGSGSI